VEVERRHKKGKIYFVDDYFSLNKERLLKIFKLISKDKTLNLEWSCQARVDGVDRDILKLAKKTGCNMIIYGIETGDEEELKYINKKTTLEQTEKAVLLTKESGIKTRANFMIGFPNSTHKTIKNSLKFAKKLNADIYRFFIVSPLPNTVLWDRVLKKNPELSKIGWDKFDFYSPCYDTLELKKEEISDYVGAAYLYMLKGLLIKEFTIGLLPNVFKLGRLIIKTKRLRGNISKSFPVFVNLFLELWFIVKGMGLKERLVYLKKIFILERKIRKDK